MYATFMPQVAAFAVPFAGGRFPRTPRARYRKPFMFGGIPELASHLITSALAMRASDLKGPEHLCRRCLPYVVRLASNQVLSLLQNFWNGHLFAGFPGSER